MIIKIKYSILIIFLLILASCENKVKQLEGKWIGRSLSSPMLEESIKSFPENVRNSVRKQQDSTIQLKVDSMYIEFEMNTQKYTKGILYTNVYNKREVVLWQFLEKENQIRLYEPEKEDRYWNVVEFTQKTLIVEMNDGKSDWKMSFVKDKEKDLKLTQK